MVYDDLYIALRDRLLDPTKTDLGIRTIDWANEQAERMEAGERVEGLLLPAVLVRYEEPEWKARGRKHSEAEGIIYLDVIRELSDHPLASDRAPATVAATRATYDAVKEIAKRVVGMRGEGYGTVGLVGLQPDHSYRRLRVDTIALRSLLCMDLDAEEYQTVPRPALAIGTNPPMPVPTLLQQHIDGATPAAVVAAVNNSPQGPAIIDELCDCEGPGAPVEIRNSAGALLGAVTGGDPPFVAPDAVTRTTTGAVIVQVTPSGESENLPQSANRYIDQSGSTAVTAASNTEYGGGLLRPAYLIPRFTLLKADGVTPGAYRDIANPFYTLPEEGDPIIYNFGRHLHAGPAASSVLGDDPWLFQQLWYDLTQTVGYLSKRQQLVDDETLVWPNAFGNTNRFTAPDGTAYDVAGNRTFIDHFTRLQWYVHSAPLTGLNWTDIIAAAEAHSFGGHSDWHLPGLRLLLTLLNYKQAGVLNYGPILRSSFTWFTGTTVPGTVGSAYGVIVAGGTTGTVVASSKAGTTNRYGLFVRRWTPPTP